MNFRLVRKNSGFQTTSVGNNVVFFAKNCVFPEGMDQRLFWTNRGIVEGRIHRTEVYRSNL